MSLTWSTIRLASANRYHDWPSNHTLWSPLWLVRISEALATVGFIQVFIPNLIWNEEPSFYNTRLHPHLWVHCTNVCLKTLPETSTDFFSKVQVWGNSQRRGDREQFSKFSFSLESLAFIIGIIHCQLFFLKWQIYHSLESVSARYPSENNHRLSVVLSHKNCVLWSTKQVVQLTPQRRCSPGVLPGDPPSHFRGVTSTLPIISISLHKTLKRRMAKSPNLIECVIFRASSGALFSVSGRAMPASSMKSVATFEVWWPCLDSR